ncbi:MAG: endonuclease/exonuclease/phosphatase family protein [Chitinophagaceae bacterium]
MGILKITLFVASWFIFCAKEQVSYVQGGGADTSGLRVLTYNIHHANPPSKPDYIDVDAITKVINQQQADLVALQEIDVHTTRSGVTLHESEYIAAKTGMFSYFAKSIDYGGGGYGIAILSKYPITAMKKFALPTIESTKGEPRILATAEITLPGNKKILFACTHLDALRTDSNRVMQINKILEILKPEKLPVILAGDLNADPGSSTIGILDSHFTRTCITADCPFTIPQDKPRKTIDFISFAPKEKFTVLLHKAIDEKYASDHLPVFAILKLK